MGFFTLEQLRNIKLVISHGNTCPDGLASAMIVADAYGDKRPEIRLIDHGSAEKADLEPVPNMMFVDCSPLPEKAEPFIAAGAIVLDHHAKGSSVQAFVKAGLGILGDERRDIGVCGAVLAYEHVWKPLREASSPEGMLAVEPIVREFARLSGIRDTWQTRDPSWLKACEQAEGVRFWPLERALAAGFPEAWHRSLGLDIGIGEVLWARKCKTVSKIAEKVMKW